MAGIDPHNTNNRHPTQNLSRPPVHPNSIKASLTKFARRAVSAFPNMDQLLSLFRPGVIKSVQQSVIL